MKQDLLNEWQALFNEHCKSPAVAHDLYRLLREALDGYARAVHEQVINEAQANGVDLDTLTAIANRFEMVIGEWDANTPEPGDDPVSA